MTLYKAALAAVHDADFLFVAENAARELLLRLPGAGITSGHVLDLGCGSGRLLELMNDAGFSGTGVDTSAALLTIAGRRCSTASYLCESLYEANLPAARIVTAVGEIFNYLPSRDAVLPGLAETFARIRKAMRDGGLFLFDLAMPGRGTPDAVERRLKCGDWQLDLVIREYPDERLLSREIVLLRGDGSRDTETHWLRLFEEADIRAALEQNGFNVEVLDGYRDFCFPAGWRAFACSC